MFKNGDGQRKQRIVWVKKNLIDQTAALSYSTGVSIVHLAIFVSFHFVPMIDMTNDEGLRPECIEEGNSWSFLMSFSRVCHMILFLSNFYREIFTAQTDIFGQIMRIVEIACIPLYLFQILMSIELVCTAMIRWTVQSGMTDEKIQELFFTGTEYSSNILYKKCPLREFN